MQKISTPISTYLESLPDERKEDIKKLDELISNTIPNAEKSLWEGTFWGGSEQKIIGYGDHSYTRSDKKVSTWFIVGLAMQKNYITVFVSAVEDKQYVAEKYKDELGKVKVGKSSISFKKIEDVNIETLKKVVKKSFELLS